jgi:hypothetical protein
MNKLSEVIAEADQVRSTVNAAFGGLSSEQIKWKPSPSEWSIAQCLEHLLLLNKPYIPQIEKILAGKRQASLWERAPLLPAFFGRLVLAAVQPASNKKSRRDRRSYRYRMISISEYCTASRRTRGT